MSEEKSAKKKSKVGIIILVIVIILLVAGGAAAATLVLTADKEGGENNSSSVSENTAPTREVIVNEENVDDILSSMEEDEYTPVGYYTVKMNPEWRFPDGKSPSENAYVENSTVNTNSVYFDIVRNDTQETIYASPILTVGSSISKFELDTELEKGTYDCTCTYQILDENNEPTSHLNVEVTIVVQN